MCVYISVLQLVLLRGGMILSVPLLSQDSGNPDFYDVSQSPLKFNAGTPEGNSSSSSEYAKNASQIFKKFLLFSGNEIKPRSIGQKWLALADETLESVRSNPCMDHEALMQHVSGASCTDVGYLTSETISSGSGTTQRIPACFDPLVRAICRQACSHRCARGTTSATPDTKAGTGQDAAQNQLSKNTHLQRSATSDDNDAVATLAFRIGHSCPASIHTSDNRATVGRDGVSESCSCDHIGDKGFSSGHSSFCLEPTMALLCGDTCGAWDISAQYDFVGPPVGIQTEGVMAPTLQRTSNLDQFLSAFKADSCHHSLFGDSYRPELCSQTSESPTEADLEAGSKLSQSSTPTNTPDFNESNITTNADHLHLLKSRPNWSCSSEMQTPMCASGVAEMVQFQTGTFAAPRFTKNGCKFSYFAQYQCVGSPSTPNTVPPPLICHEVQGKAVTCFAPGRATNTRN